MHAVTNKAISDYHYCPHLLRDERSHEKRVKEQTYDPSLLERILNILEGADDSYYKTRDSHWDNSTILRTASGKPIWLTIPLYLIKPDLLLLVPYDEIQLTNNDHLVFVRNTRPSRDLTERMSPEWIIHEILTHWVTAENDNPVRTKIVHQSPNILPSDLKPTNNHSDQFEAIARVRLIFRTIQTIHQDPAVNIPHQRCTHCHYRERCQVRPRDHVINNGPTKTISLM